jgi:hypothetical protein
MRLAGIVLQISAAGRQLLLTSSLVFTPGARFLLHAVVVAVWRVPAAVAVAAVHIRMLRVAIIALVANVCCLYFAPLKEVLVCGCCGASCPTHWFVATVQVGIFESSL